MQGGCLDNLQLCSVCFTTKTLFLLSVFSTMAPSQTYFGIKSFLELKLVLNRVGHQKKLKIEVNRMGVFLQTELKRLNFFLRVSVSLLSVLLRLSRLQSLMSCPSPRCSTTRPAPPRLPPASPLPTSPWYPTPPRRPHR